MRTPRIFALVATLVGLIPASAAAQAAVPAPLPLSPGDTVRLWRAWPPLKGEVGVVTAQLADSLLLGSAPGERYSVAVGSLTRLDVRRVEVKRAVAEGAVGGLLLGAVVGGVIGFCKSGGCDGRDQLYDGVGAFYFAPIGAAIGAVVFGAIGARERPRGSWVRVRLPRR